MLGLATETIIAQTQPPAPPVPPSRAPNRQPDRPASAVNPASPSTNRVLGAGAKEAVFEQTPRATPATSEVINFQAVLSTNKTATLAAPTNAIRVAGQSTNAAPRAPRLPPFELNDGDRVLFLGDTLFEREYNYGYIEARLTAAFPTRSVIFRNLGWSADLVSGISRAGFDSADKGFDRLKESIEAVKPTVVFIGYGMAHSFDGEEGLPRFKEGLLKLMDLIQGISKDCRFVLLSPIRHEKLGAPFPDPTDHNQMLQKYSEAIRGVAVERNCRFISLITRIGDGTRSDPPIPFTDNGIHLTPYGYWTAAFAIESGLGLKPNAWRFGIGSDGNPRIGSFGLNVTGIVKTTNSVRFTATLEKGPVSAIPGYEGEALQGTLSRLQITGLQPADYTLSIDGVPVITASHTEWGNGPVIDSGPAYVQAEQLRQAIIRKNELFFHRWRPQNNTYLFLFRKHEQGQNAKEIPMFDPLIEAQERIIDELKKPRPHVYELTVANSPQQITSAIRKAPDAKRRPELSLPYTHALGLIATSNAAAIPLPKLPDQALPQFDLASDLEITVFAENPLLAKPIQMNFDPQGRLWVVSSSVYPQIEPGQPANDKVLILEDTDGDGKAEKSTVFAEGLLIPTGVEPGDGGAYVGQSTELLHFKDTDGDGKADQKRVVLSGFGTEDTHHILHTLRWGHDGQLYMNQSIYIHTHTETPHGVVRLNSGGVLHLRPTTYELGIFLKGFCNPWGHDFDEFGQSFVTDGAGFQGISLGVPGATYFTYADMRRELRSVSPGSYPKFCGLETLYSKHFPADWQGNFITCDFRAHRVVRFAINEQGSGYVTKEMPDVVRTKDVTFRPIDVKLGPDGALYIADWSNPIIQHGEVDFRDPRRDHWRGRIWRISAKNAPLVEKKNFTVRKNDVLLNDLLSANSVDRHQARRVLTERGTNVIESLATWTSAQTSEKALLEALWMYQSLDVIEPALLEKLLAAKDGRIRAAATRVVSFWHPRLLNPADLLAKLVADEHPRVRLEAVRALAKIPSARSAELALSVLDKPMDDFLDYGLWLTMNDLARPWIDAVKSGEWKVDGREKQLEFGLQAIQPDLSASVLGQLLESRPITRDGAGSWIELIGKAGGARELRTLFDKVLSGDLDDAAAARAVAALNQAGRLRKAKPSGDTHAFGKLFDHSNEKVRLEAVRLAGAWKDLGEHFPKLVAMAGAPATRSEIRDAAFESLREIGGKGVVDGLKPLAAKGSDPVVRRHAALVLSAVEPATGIPLATEVLAETSNEDDALALWRGLLGIKGSASSLTKALSKAQLPAVTGKAGLRAAREGGRNEPDLVLAIAKSANLEGDARDLTPEEIRQLVANIQKNGDPVRGEMIYRRTELACVSCHAIGGAGGKVGPDLTSIGASAQVDYLVESLLYPNRKVKEGYHSVMVETKDGQEFSGVLVRETDEQLVIRDATNKEVAIAKNNVERRAVGGSLMPTGLIDPLSAAEQADLYRFLSELGKPGPFDASKGNVARSWKIRPIIHTDEQDGADTVVKGAMKDDEWTPVSALVDGRLMRNDIQEGTRASRYVGVTGVYAATKIQVPKDGPVRLQIGGVNNPAIWINGKSVAPSAEVQTNLTAGTHTIVVRLDAKALPEHLRVATSDGTFVAN